MIDDRGAAALDKALRPALLAHGAMLDALDPTWIASIRAAILGEHGRFLPDWREFERLAFESAQWATAKEAEVERLRAARDVALSFAGSEGERADHFRDVALDAYSAWSHYFEADVRDDLWTPLCEAMERLAAVLHPERAALSSEPER